MKRQSRMVNFRVYTDTDGDILDWLDSMTEGEKSDVMRSALRAFITGQQVAAQAPESSPFDEIMRQLTDIQHRLDKGVMVSNNVGAPTPQIVTDDAPGLSQDEESRRVNKMKKARW